MKKEVINSEEVIKGTVHCAPLTEIKCSVVLSTVVRQISTDFLLPVWQILKTLCFVASEWFKQVVLWWI